MASNVSSLPSSFEGDIPTNITSEVGTQVTPLDLPAYKDSHKKQDKKNLLDGIIDIFKVYYLDDPKGLKEKQYKTIHGDLNTIVTSNSVGTSEKKSHSKTIESLLSFAFSEALCKELGKEHRHLKLHSSKKLSVHVKKDDIELILCGYFNFKTKMLILEKQAFLYIITQDVATSFSKPENSNFFACVDQIDEKHLSSTELCFKNASTKMICIDSKTKLSIDYEIFRLIQSDESIEKIAKNKCPKIVDRVLADEHMKIVPIHKIFYPKNVSTTLQDLDYEIGDNKSANIKKTDTQPIVLKSPSPSIFSYIKALTDDNNEKSKNNKKLMLARIFETALIVTLCAIPLTLITVQLALVLCTPYLQAVEIGIVIFIWLLMSTILAIASLSTIIPIWRY